MIPRMTLCLCSVLTAGHFLLDCRPLAAQDQFPPEIDPGLLAQHVRTTEPLAPEEELTRLFVPEGFRVDLVVSEPAIAKPMNLAFDDRGRLWISHSQEYPFAAPADAPHHDRITVVEDRNHDGIPETPTDFADGLNIPIGLCPYGDGVICFSIPNILFLHDTDGDGREDTREVLYGPFDTTRDTHGMCNAFRRGQDGWIYACHGFNNQSTVSGRDGHTVTMKSGNVFRFRPDGSRIEHYTLGQVNPFGMAIDRFGDIFTADCHTKPVTLLIPGGCYESFGQPHDGLGFVPPVMNHLHGSTAIGGIALGESLAFPPAYRDSTFGGNVMTSRVNRNRLERTGGSVTAIEETDFVVSADPWFRPVDLIPGPDGALYVADFYNRIIGHYEVDLKHPGRDRFRGRVWRVSSTDAPPVTGDNTCDLSSRSLAEVVEMLPTANSVTGQMLMDRIVATAPDDPVALLSDSLVHTSPDARWRALRILQRLGRLDLETLQAACADPDEVVRTQAYRALAEMEADPGFPPGIGPLKDAPLLTAEMAFQGLITRGLLDTDGITARAAADAARNHPREEFISCLIVAWQAAPMEDVHLRQAIRIALRELLRNDAWLTQLEPRLTDAELPLIAGLCPGIATPRAAEFIAAHVEALAGAPDVDLPGLLRFAAGRVHGDAAAALVSTIRRIQSDNLTEQLSLLSSMSGAGADDSVDRAFTDWASDLTCRLLEIPSPEEFSRLLENRAIPWSFISVDGDRGENCWGATTARRSSDGVTEAPMHSSFEAGESRRGILRSAEFPLPRELSFFMAGHDGFPDQPAQNRNLVRLRDADTNAILRVAAPPRNDEAQRVAWDLIDAAGHRAGVIELVDGDNGRAYAWIAVGRFSLNALNPDDSRIRHRQAMNLIVRHQLHSFEPAIIHLLEQCGDEDSDDLSLYALALAGLRRDARLTALALVPQLAPQTPELGRAAVEAVIANRTADSVTLLGNAVKSAPLLRQQQLSETLAESPAGAQLLLSLLNEGVVSLQVLFHAPTRSKLMVTLPEPDRNELAERLKKLPGEETQLTEAISRYRQLCRDQPGNPEQGVEVFRKNCSVCHQIAGEGKRIGPNLDGIGNRGLDRIVEDILAPNRNVDAAFRASTVVLSDGRTLTGLVREATDGGLEIVDAKGEPASLDPEAIDERIESLLSPMPSNVQQLLTEQQTRDLIAWLLQQRR